jgi:CCR4-NOT transcriptional complex subunit CAF120
MMGYGDVANHLSAREQEHVARMTGSSFFDMSSNNQKPQPSAGGGLVSSIDAREREKRAMKEGMSNHMVQHAIAHRNQQMMQQPPQPQQQFTPQQYAPQYAGSLYHPQAQAPVRQGGMYNMPAASQTWDALQQVNPSSEPRRQSWYGQLSQAPPTPPTYQQSQNYVQQGGNYYSGVNTMHH